MSKRADHHPFLGFRKELAYGQRDGVQVSIDEVDKGAGCNCICLGCKTPLIARKGERKIHHFAHRASGKRCGGGLETNAHLWAKLALQKALWINLPKIHPKAAGLSRLVHRGGRYPFIDAQLETHAGEIVPDVQLIAADGRKLIVEVCVTHACDQRKIDRIRAGGVSAIEVDISRWKGNENAEAIAMALLTDAPRRWLFNPTIDKTEAELIEEAAERARMAAERQRRQAVEAALAEAHAQAERIAQGKASAERKVAADRDARESAIRANARRVLGLDADAWLTGDWEHGAGSRMEAAVASDDGLTRVRGALGQKAQALEEERRKAAVAATFRSRLRQAAASVFSAAHAAFFLKNRPAGLGSKRDQA